MKSQPFVIGCLLLASVAFTASVVVASAECLEAMGDLQDAVELRDSVCGRQGEGSPACGTANGLVQDLVTEVLACVPNL